MKLLLLAPSLVLLSNLPFADTLPTRDIQDTPTSSSPPADVPDYARDVRPILAEVCFDCHGPDSAVRQADLRLDQKDGLFGDHGGWRAVTAGDLEASELWTRILDADDPMPPAEAQRQLTEENKRTLERWIAGGAPFASHWAFEPIARPAAPAVEDAADGSWVRNDLDAFVLARMRGEGLAPSPEADAITLLRRVTLDLTGLPPSPEELDAFLADPSEEAYAKAVDRLLASDRYAERQARSWLDIARYADSNGDAKDGTREMWRWREYVIESFRNGKPFDQFITEQVAGDLIPDAGTEQKIATGFLRNHPIFTKSGVLEDEYRHAYVVDRANTVGTAFLGLTVGCAQCHDHKYDPISQKEYFGLFAFFNHASERDVGRSFGNTRPVLHLPIGEDGPRLTQVEARLAELDAELDGDHQEWDAAFDAWCEAQSERAHTTPAWTVLEPSSMMSLGGAQLTIQDDGSVLAEGWNPGSDTYNLILRPGKTQIQALRLEVLPDASLPRGGSGRSERGTFSLGELEVYVCTEASGDRGDRVEFARGEDDASIDRYSTADRAVDGGEDRSWTLFAEEVTEAHEAIFVPTEPIDLNANSILRIAVQNSGARRARDTLGRFRLSMTGDVAVRERLIPIEMKSWQALGPFPEHDPTKALAKAWEPEESIADGVDLDASYKKPKLAKKSKDDGNADAQESPATKAMDAKPGAKVIATTKATTTKGATANAEAQNSEPKSDIEQADGDSMRSTDESDEDEATDDDEEEDRADEDEDGPPENAGPPFGKRGSRSNVLKWTEMKDWRDGMGARISGKNSAWYLMRNLEVDRPRRVRLWVDGGEGLVAWLDGERIHERPVPPPAPKDEHATSSGQGFGDFGFGPTDPDFDPDPKDPDRYERAPYRLNQAFTFDLKPGEHELVLKVATRSSTTRLNVRFDVVGEDVLTLAAARAIRELDDALVGPTRSLPDPGAHQTSLTAEIPSEVEPEWASVVLPDPVAARRDDLRRFFRERALPEVEERWLERARLRGERLTIYGRSPDVMVMNDDRPRTTRLLTRGAWDQPAGVVEPHTPAVLPPLQAEGTPDRLDLARWLVAPENPLTARVTVDRFWAQHFGRGLIATPGDLGVRGAPPTHPHLLDWLSATFVESGWDVRALHKTIVTSATYRQSCKVRPEVQAVDPTGSLLAGMPRVRLAAEEVRDNALAVSGLLVEKLGGPSVKPYQPAGLWDNIGSGGGGGAYRTSKGDDLYRRGLYVFWRRSMLYPSFAVFDAPSRVLCSVERIETNTPLQALVLLNDPVFIEAGRQLGLRMLQEGGVNDGARLAYGYRLATSRMPDNAELTILLQVLNDQREHWKENERDAKRYLKVGSKKLPEDLKDAEPETLAPWAAVGQMLLNLDTVLHRN
tara:strand:+ start:1015 stop:5175 length:4161 start_codon:yes stop_codon:yes gene_type:complete